MSAPDRPSSLNLEYLKKHAKHLLRACRDGDASAIAEMRAGLTHLAALHPSQIIAGIHLADVQHALALQRGFSSWAELTRQGDPLARLLAAVRGGHSRSLRRQLHEFTGLAAVSVHAASALGNATALARHLETDPALAMVSDGRWLPLMYVCGSPLARFSARHAMSLLTCAELLLDAGADANIDAADDRGSLGIVRVPAVLRAAMSGNIALMMLLRKRGAPEPADAVRQVWAQQISPESHSLHSMFGEYFRRPEVRAQMEKAQAEFRARGGVSAAEILEPRQAQRMDMPNVLSAKADLWAAMLDRGYDPAAIGSGGSSPLHWVATYGPAAFVELLLSRGVKTTGRDDRGRSVVAVAVRAGNVDVADLLRARGIEDDATPVDRFLGACLAGQVTGVHDIVAAHPEVVRDFNRDDAEALVSAAGRGAIGPVRLMLDVGIQPDTPDETGATALHQAAWRGQLEMVRLLLDHGAGTGARDGLYGETPREWALHGSVHADGAGDQCRAIAEMLVEAR